MKQPSYRMEWNIPMVITLLSSNLKPTSEKLFTGIILQAKNEVPVSASYFVHNIIIDKCYKSYIIKLNEREVVC